MKLPAGWAWMPRYDSTQAWPFDPRSWWKVFWLCAGLAVVFALPPVALATGVPALVSAPLVLSYGIGALWRIRAHARASDRQRARLVLGEVAHGVLVAVGLVAASEDPLTPLWALCTLYASMDGVDYDFPPLVSYAALHTLSPLLTVAFFVARGHPVAQAVGAPLFFALLNFVAYHYGATRKIVVRRLFQERDSLRATLAAEVRESERERIAEALSLSLGRDLQAAVARGSAADEPSRDPAADLGAVARRGLHALRALLDRLQAEPAPAPSTEPAPRAPLYRVQHRLGASRAWTFTSRDMWTAAALAGAITGFLMVPGFAALLGLRAVIAAPLTGLFVVWCVVLAVFRARLVGAPRPLLVVSWVTGALGVLAADGLVLATGEPTTALWALPVLYASFNGAEYEIPPSLQLLGLHCAAALATIPGFLLLGAPTATSIGLPILFAFVCFLAYHNNAVRAQLVRDARAQKERLALALEGSRLARQEERLARDLHDTVGASLSLAAVYGDLLEQRRDDTAAAERLRRAMGEAAEQSLRELHALFEGLQPGPSELRHLADSIRERAARLAEAAGVVLEVRVEGGERPVEPEVRYALARIAQEAIGNALRHARAKRIDVELAAEPDGLRLAVRDDGPGFDPERVRQGRGLRNMRARAEELGGSVRFEAGDRTSVVVRLPATEMA